MKEGSGNGASLSLSLSLRELCEGNLEGVFFTGDPKGYVEERPGNGPLSPYEPRWGTWKGIHLPGTLNRQMKEGSGNSAHLSLGAL